jgi:Ca2+-binding RTX toxin-like protein
MVNRTGSEQNDLLSGTTNPDHLKGMGGNDFLDGQLGNDKLDGGTGDDWITGHGWDPESSTRNPYYAVLDAAGGGSDKLGGGEGDDHLIDYDGPKNKLDGGDGNDIILSGHAIDTLIGGRGDDYMDGGLGFDLYYPGVGNDTISDYSPNPGGVDETWYIGLPDNPDADVFYFEANLGPIGNDQIELFDPGMDKIKIEDYKHVTVSDGGLDTESFGFPLHRTILSFDDGSSVTLTSEETMQPGDVIGVGPIQVDWLFV